MNMLPALNSLIVCLAWLVMAAPSGCDASVMLPTVTVAGKPPGYSPYWSITSMMRASLS